VHGLGHEVLPALTSHYLDPAAPFSTARRHRRMNPNSRFAAPWPAAVVTVSDRGSAGEREDRSGPALVRRLEELGFAVTSTHLVPDERAQVADLLRDLAAGDVALVVTTGGTGLAPRDVTPEAALDVAERQVPGLMELARRRCAERTPFAALSRGVAVTRGRTLVINLPGNPQAALETLQALEDVLPHAVRVLHRPPEDCEVTGRASGEGT
jgi:molybdenum cofactor synthesis domain-containing protein